MFLIAVLPHSDNRIADRMTKTHVFEGLSVRSHEFLGVANSNLYNMITIYIYAHMLAPKILKNYAIWCIFKLILVFSF